MEISPNLILSTRRNPDRKAEMQAHIEIDHETEEKRLRLEGFMGGPGPLGLARLQKRMDARAEELKRQGAEMVARVHLRKKKMDPRRFRRAKKSR